MKSIISFILIVLLSGCQSTHKVSHSPSDTKLFKTWSNVYLVEMVNAIVNDDFKAYAFYMAEYEDTLKEEQTRIIKFLSDDEDHTRYGDTEHEYYVRTTMRMAEGNTEAAYFYLTRYMDVMKNRFLYNQDWKPIPDYAK